jgi:DNA invertase Pin-like site-specific DNA recombinase
MPLRVDRATYRGTKPLPNAAATPPVRLDGGKSKCYTISQDMMYIAMHNKVLAYYRTSSATNVGEDNDSLTRQRVAVERYATVAGFEIVEEFYDAAVSGADALDERPGFAEALRRIAANGVRTIIVETASRFARDLIVAETGFRRLRDAGITLISADAPSSFLDDTPTSAFIRQVLAAVQELDRTMTVAKLRGARQRKKAHTGKCEGAKSYAEKVPATVARAKALRASGMTLRQITDQMTTEGFKTASASPYQMTAIGRMISGKTR